MEGTGCSNGSTGCEIDLGDDHVDPGPPSSKKARYPWQVKSSAAKERNASLNQKESDVSTIQSDSYKSNSSRGEPLNNISQIPPNVNTAEKPSIENSAPTACCLCLSSTRLEGAGQNAERGKRLCRCAPLNQSGKRSLKRKLVDSPESNRQTETAMPRRNRAVQPPHLVKWQKEHIAKAVVDNAVNKTLSALGISPDSDVNLFAAQSRSVEMEGVSTVIQSRGLKQPGLEATDMFEQLLPGSSDNRRVALNGMFHMMGLPDFNLALPSEIISSTENNVVSDLGNAERIKENILEDDKISHKKRVKLSTDDGANTGADPSNTEFSQPNTVINEALSVVIAERGLLLK